MPIRVDAPVLIEAVGTPPKRIAEHVGRVRTGDEAVSVAQMSSPAGWSEPGQRPEFREITLVLRGALHVDFRTPAGALATLVVAAGQSVITEPGEWVRYRTPEGADYVAVCLPAFSPSTVHRDAT